MTEYYTYWSLNDLPSNHFNPVFTSFCIALLFLTVFALLVKNKHKITYDNKKPLTVLTLLLGLTAFLLGSYWTVFPIEKNEPYKVLLERDLVSEVEGVISNFNTVYTSTRVGTRTSESFSIGGIDFHYNDYHLSRLNRFSKTSSNGGILKNGLFARVTYIKENKRIVKIELKKVIIQNP